MASKSKSKAVATPSTTALASSKSPPNIEIDAAHQPGFLPSKITEDEWQELISVDEGVEVVLGLLEDILDNAASIVYDHHLEREIFPYAVQEAKKSILKTIALEFIARDEGDVDTENDPTWQCDEPPVPAPIDSWARGIIREASSEDVHTLIDALEPIHVQKPASVAAPSEIGTTAGHTATTRKSTSTTVYSTTSSGYSRPSKKKKHSTTSLSQSTSKRSHPQAKLVPLGEEQSTAAVSAVSGVQTPKKTSMKMQSLSPTHVLAPPSPSGSNEPRFTPFGLKRSQLYWMQDVKFDEQGKIVHMPKLDPSQLPPFWTKPEVSIIYSPKDIAQPKPRPIFNSFQHDSIKRKPSKERGRKLKASSLHAPPRLHVDSMEFGGEEGGGRRVGGRGVTIMPSDAGLSEKDSGRRFPSIPALPSIVDTIDPLPGVTVREGDRTVHGPIPHFRHSVSPGYGLLKPVKPLEEKEGKERTKSDTPYASKMYTHVAS